MTTTNTIDAARVELLLNELRLPTFKLMWAQLAGQSDKEGWPAARFLAALAEHEMADRGRRRIQARSAAAAARAGTRPLHHPRSRCHRGRLGCSATDLRPYHVDGRPRNPPKYC